MSRSFVTPPRALIVLMALGVCNHTVLAASRVVVSLDALAGGASAAIVGLLMALFALLPMFFGIAIGKLADRIGLRRPMLWGSIGCAIAAALPAIVHTLPALFASASLMGLSFILFQVPTQQATGEMSSATERAVNFSWLALAYSGSGFLGPLIAGFAIDSLGYKWAFALIAVIPLVPILMVWFFTPWSGM